MTPILDACCGSRMFWFDKQNTSVTFMDNRELEVELCDGRFLEIKPDIVADFKNMPFDNESYYMVVFDPPHLLHAGDDSWLAQKYGRLTNNWREDIKQGLRECMRVLKPYGTLVFKWCEDQITTGEILRLIDYKPLFGQRRGKTIWLVFMRGVSDE